MLASARVEVTQLTAAVPQAPSGLSPAGWTTLQLSPSSLPMSSTGEPYSLPRPLVGYWVPVATTCEPVIPIHPRYTPRLLHTVFHERPEFVVREIRPDPVITTPSDAEEGCAVSDATNPRWAVTTATPTGVPRSVGVRTAGKAIWYEALLVRLGCDAGPEQAVMATAAKHPRAVPTTAAGRGLTPVANGGNLGAVMRMGRGRSGSGDLCSFGWICTCHTAKGQWYLPRRAARGNGTPAACRGPPRGLETPVRRSGNAWGEASSGARQGRP